MAVVKQVSQGTAEIQFKSGLVQNVAVELLIQYDPRKRPLLGQLQLFGNATKTQTVLAPATAGAGGLFLIYQRSIGPQITARHFRTDSQVGGAMIDDIVFHDRRRSMSTHERPTTSFPEHRTIVGQFSFTAYSNEHGGGVGIDACENLAETASVCAGKCTKQIAVSRFGREYH